MSFDSQIITHYSKDYKRNKFISYLTDLISATQSRPTRECFVTATEMELSQARYIDVCSK